MTKSKFQRAIKNPSEAVNYLWRQTFKVIGHQIYKKFIILGRVRTGSSMLLSFLASHPNTYARGEMFQRLNGQNCRTILNSMFSKQPPGIKAVGFKVFYHHPYDDDSGRLWTMLINIPELHIIHIKRKNILRSIVSEKIAHKTGQWEIINKQAQLGIQNRQIELDYESLKNRFKTIKCLSNEFDEKFTSHPKLIVYYEELLNQIKPKLNLAKY